MAYQGIECTYLTFPRYDFLGPVVGGFRVGCRYELYDVMEATFNVWDDAGNIATYSFKVKNEDVPSEIRNRGMFRFIKSINN